MEKETITTMTFELPVSLHTDLKKIAAERRTTIKALLVECAQGIVKRNQHADRTADARAPYSSAASDPPGEDEDA